MNSGEHAGDRRGFTLLAAVVILPLLGARLAHRPLRGFFCFPPPLEIPSAYPRFSWWVVAVEVVVLATIFLSWILQRRRVRIAPATTASTDSTVHRFPWWGWVALLWTVLWWIVAWTRFAGFTPLQRLTFFPLWLGFIVAINALTWHRGTASLMQRAPAQWVGLFAASAGFWWLFEWLNRFVRNWHYLGIQDFNTLEYVALASVCFSTVLPAVVAVREWLGTFPGFVTRCAAGPSWGWFGAKRTGRILLLAGLVSLVLTGAQPQVFYPALWLAPLALAVGEANVRARPGLSREIALGDWHRAAAWMLAALVSGFFWELWNGHSLAKWIYTVPYADRWHVFEMPLLGYAGYLPFGLECGVVVERLFRGRVP